MSDTRHGYDDPLAAARTGAPPARARVKPRRGGPPRAWIFIALAIACSLVATGYVAWAARRGGPVSGSVAPSGGVEATGTASGSLQDGRAPSGLATVRPAGARAKGGGAARPRVIFQHVARDANYAKVAVLPLGDRAGTRTTMSLTCERVHFAAGRGLCLAPNRTFTSYTAGVFGPDFKIGRRISLSGTPSRARVSPDGRFGSVTVFVAGHSYSDGGFSTRTTLIDMAAGAALGDLEQFEVTRGGKRIQSPDFNYWGVTFARGGDRFYATLATRGKTYLVEGGVRSRRLRVLRENVECPSLSPDNTRIAYKKLVGRGPEWRLHVLDLATMTDTPLAETRSVDDQVEWLDDDRVLYGDGGDVWVTSGDGRGAPRKFLTDALSPAVVR